jgi:hypothetical protein
MADRPTLDDVEKARRFMLEAMERVRRVAFGNETLPLPAPGPSLPARAALPVSYLLAGAAALAGVGVTAYVFGARKGRDWRERLSAEDRAMTVRDL